jgi:MFS family permease
MTQDDSFRPSARLLYLITGLFWLSQYAFTPYINRELAGMGMNATFMGLVSGAYGLSQTLLRLPIGIWSDRLGRRKPFVLAGCGMVMLAAAGYLLVYTPGGFLASRLVSGAAAASWVAFTVLYSAYFPREEGPRRITDLNVANISGRLVGYVLVTGLLVYLSVKVSFVVSLIAGALAFALALGLKEPAAERVGTGIKEMAQVARNRYLLIVSFLGILTQWVAFSSYYSFNVNAAMALGAGEESLSMLQVALIVPNILSNLLVSRALSKGAGARKLVTAGFLVVAVYCLLVPLARTLPQLFLLQPLGGISSSLTFAVLLGQCVREIPPHKRSMAMGFYQATYGIGMTLGPIVMGMMVDGMGLKGAFFVIAGLALVSSALARGLMKSEKQTE